MAAEPHFTLGELVEIRASGAPVGLARVRGVTGPWIYVALEPGGYLPWSVEPVFVRRTGARGGPHCSARVLHAAGETATLLLVSEGRREPFDTVPQLKPAPAR